MNTSLTCTAVLALAILVLIVSPVMSYECNCGLPDFDEPSPPPDTGPSTGPSDGGGSPGGSSGPSSGGSSSEGASGSSSSGSGSQSSGSSGTSAEALLLEARDLFRQGMYNESLAVYNKTVAADPASFPAWMEKGSTEVVLGMYASALSSFERAAKIKPGDADPWVSRGEVLLAAGDPSSATAAFDRALAIYPGLPAALDGKARAEEAERQLSSPVPEETPALEETAANETATPVPGNVTPESGGVSTRESPFAATTVALAFVIPAVLRRGRRS